MKGAGNVNEVALKKTTSKTIFSNILKNLNRSKYLYMMLLLPLVYFVLFKYKPMYGVLIAFKDFKVKEGIMGSDWVGLEHFVSFLTDPEFFTIFKNTIILSVTQILICFPIPVIFALFINEIRGKKLKGLVERVSCFPHFISVVVVVSVLMTFVSKEGLANQIIVAFGGTAKSFMLDSAWFRPLYIISDIWQEAGWGSIIYLAALSNVDIQLYEACDMDGGGRFTKLWHITLPSIMPTVIIMFILRMGSIMGLSFEKVLLMQNSSIFETADVIATYVYRRGLQGAQYSYATAVGVFESIIGIGFLLGSNAITKKLNNTSLF